MITTQKVFAFAALIVAVGLVITVELTRSAGKADSNLVPYGISGYARSRVDAAFDGVAAMPRLPAVIGPMAAKGDLPAPFGCTDVSGDAQAECVDVAYEVLSGPRIVVETRIGNTSILRRKSAMALANLTGDELHLPSEKRDPD